MNLRDKLRSGGGPDPLEGADEASLEAEAPRAVGGAGPRLDVNRRFLLLAAAAAFLTAVVGVAYLNKSAAGLSEGGTKVEVVVLAEDVSRGAPLSDDRLTTATIPRAYLPKGVIEAGEDGKGLEQAKGMVALAPMVAGEPLVAVRVGPPDRKLGIAYLLRRGERAKTISVDSASGLAGLIKPGNEVDLIATIPDPNNDNRRIGTPVLQRARVIAVGDHLLGEVRNEEETRDESGGIASDSTVTLAVPAAKIGVLTLLEDLGNLKVVLRAEDDDTVQKAQFSDDAVMALVSGRMPSRVAPRQASPPQAAPRPRVIVRHVAPSPAPPRPRSVTRPQPPRPATRPAGGPSQPRQPQVIRFGGSGGE
ncbi:MAG: Flp pilus assembly protein CpaB [Candidatus Sericytochromatia bacterium]|nr:Flp pilus assembly protein CpaB [Candidatus Sericytochromatia bacterium]